MSIKRMKIKHMAITRGIKHWGLGGYASILPRIKFVVTGQESSPQAPTISYRHRYRQCKKSKLFTINNIVIQVKKPYIFTK
jgi:hypothetical protein